MSTNGVIVLCLRILWVKLYPTDFLSLDILALICWTSRTVVYTIEQFFISSGPLNRIRTQMKFWPSIREKRTNGSCRIPKKFFDFFQPCVKESWNDWFIDSCWKFTVQSPYTTANGLNDKVSHVWMMYLLKILGLCWCKYVMAQEAQLCCKPI